MSRKELARQVDRIIADQPVTDLHTHVYAPVFGASPKPGGLLLWGIDELVTYHYLVAEVFRVVPASVLPYEKFWQMSKAAQADHIWKHLFVERTPLSEACRGVITTLDKLGLDPNERTLTRYRRWFAAQDASQYIDKVMALANVDQITMTNAVFDDQERALWDSLGPKAAADPRFATVLRCDQLLTDWPQAVTKMAAMGYAVATDLSGASLNELRRFLSDWLKRTKAVYLAMSLPPSWRYPDPANPLGDRIVREALLPVLAQENLPWAMMIGSLRGVNPALKDAGDIGVRADVLSVAHLCRDFSGNKFMVTMLARENQHELCVVARKFGNLLPFGCWWFLNNPSLIEEMTRMRLELLGATITPQHSDARILDQLIYKWTHSRQVIAKVLTDKYADLKEAGLKITKKMMKRDAALLLRDNYRNFIKK